MSPTLIATIAGLTTALCWGTGDWLSAKSTKKLGAMQINFAVSIAAVIMTTILFLVSDISMPTQGQFVAIGAGGTLITLAYIFFVKALATGPVGVIVPLGNSYPLVTVGLSIVILSEVFSTMQVAAMVGIVLGAALLAYEKNRNNIPIRELHKDTLLAAAAAITWGVAFFILDPVVGKVSWQTMYIVIEIFMFPLSFALLAVTYKSKVFSAVKESASSKPALLAGAVGTLGFMAFYLGSDRAGSLIIPTVLSACGPLVASILGAVFDHEKLGTLKRAGAVLVVAGIIVLNIA